MAKSNVVSGMGVALSLVQTLVASVKKAGGTDDDIHRLATPEANGDWDRIGVQGTTFNRHSPPAEHEQGKKEQSFALYYFGKETESDWVIAQMERDGKRPATIRELLVFGETNPELQRQFPIVALGSVWVRRRGIRPLPT